MAKRLYLTLWEWERVEIWRQMFEATFKNLNRSFEFLKNNVGAIIIISIIWCCNYHFACFHGELVWRHNRKLHEAWQAGVSSSRLQIITQSKWRGVTLHVSFITSSPSERFLKSVHLLASILSFILVWNTLCVPNKQQTFDPELIRSLGSQSATWTLSVIVMQADSRKADLSTRNTTRRFHFVWLQRRSSESAVTCSYKTLGLWKMDLRLQWDDRWTCRDVVFLMIHDQIHTVLTRFTSVCRLSLTDKELTKWMPLQLDHNSCVKLIFNNVKV